MPAAVALQDCFSAGAEVGGTGELGDNHVRRQARARLALLNGFAGLYAFFTVFPHQILGQRLPPATFFLCVLPARPSRAPRNVFYAALRRKRLRLLACSRWMPLSTFPIPLKYQAFQWPAEERFIRRLPGSYFAKVSHPGQ